MNLKVDINNHMNLKVDTFPGKPLGETPALDDILITAF